MAVLHVKFRGESHDIQTSEIFAEDRLAVLGISEEDALTDTQVKQALANWFDAAIADFNSYEIERHTNGNMTVRPQAVFG